jgi:hypothetical protein
MVRVLPPSIVDGLMTSFDCVSRDDSNLQRIEGPRSRRVEESSWRSYVYSTDTPAYMMLVY